MIPTCDGCGHKHHPYEAHVPGPIYDPWSDPAVNTDLRITVRR